MNPEGNAFLYFEMMKKEFKLNNLFLTIDSRNHVDKGSFIVCENKHKAKWRSIDKTSDSIGSFDTLKEAQAFGLGICVGKNKNWKYS